jgi:hypothetical protein
MTSISELLSLAEQFHIIAAHYPQPRQLQEQHIKLEQFAEHLRKNLRQITNELGGEIVSLKERQFDPKMLKMMVKIMQTLNDLTNNVRDEQPYTVGERLVQSVLEKPNSTIIDNLDFLAKHHLKQTNLAVLPHSKLTQPELHSLDRVRQLAAQVKSYMSSNPVLIGEPTKYVSPNALLETMKDVPGFHSGTEDKTRA